MEITPLMSDRQRHAILLERQKQEKQQRPQQTQKQQINNIKQTKSNAITTPYQVYKNAPTQPEKRKLSACSSCKNCDGYQKGPTSGTDKCRQCSCGLLHHLKEEDEYETRCIGDEEVDSEGDFDAYESD
eukprot:TRINITY_DN5149_c0_g1_i2.p1 TRINITY_DN5149_c0_g1~~TRINITY_DN5149_c0_g1_i2.p1  ORF type:complete len:129 (-),score=24.51 TRINITY_DN5149_c0_g1_i2:62-448(-)